MDYDGHNATDLAIRMNEDRNREDFCVEVAQTCAGQNLAVKTFRELLLQERVVIEESPWSCGVWPTPLRYKTITGTSS